MKLIIILGPPGVGKGTQCSLLAERLGYIHISTGFIIRKEILSQSDLGLRVKNLVESGKLVDDDTIFQCLDRALINLNPNNTVLLDGLPRTLAQGSRLEQLLLDYNNLNDKKITFTDIKVICIDGMIDELIKRFQYRFTCNMCGKIESINNTEDYSSQAVDLNTYICKNCKAVGSMKTRKDDDINVVRYRLDLYQQESLALISFYKKKGNIAFINGLLPTEFVYANLAYLLL